MRSLKNIPLFLPLVTLSWNFILREVLYKFSSMNCVTTASMEQMDQYAFNYIVKIYYCFIHKAYLFERLGFFGLEFGQPMTARRQDTTQVKHRQ